MPIQTAIDSINNSQASPFGFKNRLVNGAIVIDQRNGGAANNGTGAAPTYGPDRYYLFNSLSSKISIRQINGANSAASNFESSGAPTGFAYSLKFTTLAAVSTTSTDTYVVAQGVEGTNIADLGWGTANAQPVTLSFWAKSSLTGTFSGVIANAAQNYVYPFQYTINSANTWEYETVTLVGPTAGSWPSNNQTSLYVIFDLGSGSDKNGTVSTWQSTGGQILRTATANRLVGTAGATLYVTGIQLEKGLTATPFEIRPVTLDQQMCERYYQISASSFRFYTSDGFVGTHFPYRTQMMTAATTTKIFSGGNTNIGSPTVPQAIVSSDQDGVGIQWNPGVGTQYMYNVKIIATVDQ